MRISLVCLVFGIACSAGAQLPAHEDRPLWGSLVPGRYMAGFQSLYQVDTARWYDPDYPLNGKVRAKKPRPIFIAIWYPAEAARLKPMVYRDYFKALSIESPDSEFAQRLRRFTRDGVCQYAMRKELESLSKKERAVWQAFLVTRVRAVRDAPPAAGQFPVIIYHAGLGGTYEDNSVLFEYLASHGYVVISSAYEYPDASALNIGEHYASLDDLSFLARFAGTLPFVDFSHLAAMGHSYGAQAVLTWRAQPNSPVDAVVFLDSTVEYAGLDRPDLATVRSLVSRSHHSPVPVIMFADRVRKPHFETFGSYLEFAPWYQSTVDEMEHNDFVSQGAIGESLLAQLSGDPAKARAAWRNYDQIGSEILLFLNGYLKGDTASLEALKREGVTYKAPKPLAPSARQLARLWLHDGPETTRLVLTALREPDASVLAGAIEDLSEGGHKEDAVKFASMAVEFAPKSAFVQGSMGEALARTGQKAKATAAFRKALELIDTDASLKDGEKAELKKQLQEALK